MDLKNLMRMGSLAMNLMQSDHFKELMGMMGTMGDMKSPFMGRRPWLQDQSNDQQKQQGTEQDSAFPFQNFPFQNFWGMQQNRTFPFSNQFMPPWLTQRPNGKHMPKPNEMNFTHNPFFVNSRMEPSPEQHKSYQNRMNRIFIQDLESTNKQQKKKDTNRMLKKR